MGRKRNNNNNKRQKTAEKETKVVDETNNDAAADVSNIDEHEHVDARIGDKDQVATEDAEVDVGNDESDDDDDDVDNVIIDTTALEKASTASTNIDKKDKSSNNKSTTQSETPSTTQSETPSSTQSETPSTAFISDGRYRNKQRCLVLAARGITARYRHLLEDLKTLMPHHKKECKLDTGDESLAKAVTEIAQLRGCSTVMLFESRKHQDDYLWMGKINGDVVSGPSVRFQVSNIHTMDELRMTGNCMKGSRPILSFDESFARLEHLKLLKELFTDVFGTPRGHPKSKPFVDRVMAFYYADQRIWVRNYQIVEDQPSNALEAHQAKKAEGKNEKTSLVEIGPRFVLDIIRIFRGSFGGQTLYQNPTFLSPNSVRANKKKELAMEYEQNQHNKKKRKERQESIKMPVDPLADVFR